MSDSNQTENQTVTVIDNPAFVRRVHTHKSLTVREGPIVMYLIAKTYDSPAPRGVIIDKEALKSAFGIVGSFIEGIFDDIRADLAAYKRLAASGNESAAKSVGEIEKAMTAMEKYRNEGSFDRIKDIIGKARVTTRKGKAQAPEQAARVEEQQVMAAIATTVDDIIEPVSEIAEIVQEVVADPKPLGKAAKKAAKAKARSSK